MLLFKTNCPSLHLLVHQSCHLHYGTLNVSLHVRESGFRNLGNFCFWNPESSIGHGGMRTFYVFLVYFILVFDLDLGTTRSTVSSTGSYTVILLQNPGNICLWIPQPRALECVIPIMESEISLLIGIRYPSFNDEESGIQHLESGIQGVESKIQDCLGFPYLGRNVSSTDSCHLFLSNVSVFGL